MTDDINQLIGDPKKAAEELEAFQETAKGLSSSQPRMVEEYPGQWVGLHSGRVRAHGPTLESVLERIDLEGLSREQVIVRFIHTEPRTMIF